MRKGQIIRDAKGRFIRRAPVAQEKDPQVIREEAWHAPTECSDHRESEEETEKTRVSSLSVIIAGAVIASFLFAVIYIVLIAAKHGIN